MIKLNRVKELPEWFDLDRYQDCKKFGAWDWYNCLSMRREIDSTLNLDLCSGFPVGSYRFASGGIPRFICETPLDWKTYRRTHLATKDTPLSPPDFPVRELEFIDLVYIRDNGICDEYDGIDSSKAGHWITFCDDSTDILEKLDRVPVGPLDGRLETLAVDMDATDAVLVTAFSAWLKMARTRHASATSKRERPAYKDWASYGLLPYLDLMLWSKGTGTQIPHHLMAEAVGYRKGGDSFRKTVPRLANALMQSLSELEALAAIEAGPE